MKPIYLDHHATTPLLPEALEAMQPYFSEHFGNANSNHMWGWKAERAVNKALLQVSQLVGAKPSQVIFTSGATESLHNCLGGWARSFPKGRILTSSVEHKATYGACELAQAFGVDFEILPVDEWGRLSQAVLESALQSSDQPTLLSLILGNNEVGTLNDLKLLTPLKAKFSHLFIHGDGAQSVGKLALNFQDSPLDYLSFSGHKLYGPKGIGALVVKDSSTLKPLMTGGGQQSEMRAGTLDVPSIVGLGAACAWAQSQGEQESERLKKMRDYLIDELVDGDKVFLNGHPTERLPNNVNLTFRSVTMDKLLISLPKLAFSGSSACSSGQTPVSHVLKALGRSDQEARQSVRFGLGHSNQETDIEFVIRQIKKILLDS